MITVLTCTGRGNPRFDFLADSISNNLKSIAPEHTFPQWFEWLVVDMRLWYDADRRDQLKDAVKGRFPFRHEPPKPNVWQGPTRLTQSDWYALNSARNTGICLSKFNHIVLFDDCLIADANWLNWHMQAARIKISLAGCYESIKNADIKNGEIVSCEKLDDSMKDHRIKVMGEDLPPTKAYGAWFYGLNVSFPLKGALKINGFDEKYDGQGGSEDTDFGLRLERSGTPVFFSSLCKIYQILDTHDAVCGDPGFARLIGEKSQRKQKELPLNHDGKLHYANEKLIERLIQEPTRISTSPESPDILALRKLGMESKPLPTPTTPIHDWRDGQNLMEMG